MEQVVRVTKRVAFAAATAVLAFLPGVAGAQSLTDALALAYSNSPDLNAARSTARATDEGVGIAKSLQRPRINGTTSFGFQDLSYNRGGTPQGVTITHPATVGVTLVQPLFTGFQAESKIKAAESSVRAQQELVRDTEQTVLVNAATAYMNVVMYQQIQALDEQNLQFLAEQVRAAKDKLQVGEGTKTDLAQAQSSYQAAVSTLAAARAQTAAAKAMFVRYVGMEPKSLSGNTVFDKMLPVSVAKAVDGAMRDHPALKAAIFNIDVAQANVSYAEGALLPQVNLQGSFSHATQPNGYLRADTTQVGINVTIPLYQGGGEYAQVRQAKEQLGTARIQVDVSREQLRSIVAQQWALYVAAGQSIEAARSNISASQLALEGTIEQQKVGERTTLDVLNAENVLSAAKISLAQAQNQRAIALFTLLQAVGRFDYDHLRLGSVRYDPKQHYEAVKDKLIGLQTPDGR
jgi:outer membrane protein